jgi:glycosyltransferase involved in cell wall biosynthesis
MRRELQGIFAVGRPVIFVGGEDSSIARWTVESGGGWVVRENDIESLLKAVSEATDPAERERRGSAARAYAERHFDLTTNCNRICELVEAVRIV